MGIQDSILRIADRAVMPHATPFHLHKFDHAITNIRRDIDNVYLPAMCVCAMHSDLLDTDLWTKVGKVNENVSFLTFSILHLRSVLSGYDEGKWVDNADICIINGTQYKVHKVIRTGVISGGPCTHTVSLHEFPDVIQVLP